MSEDEFWKAVLDNKAPNPVRQYSDGWYFWDETWADKHGPYPTESDAWQDLKKYIETFLQERSKNNEN